MESGVKAGRAIMSYIIPPVGIITWAMIKQDRPKNAKTYLYISLISIVIGVGGTIIYRAVRTKNKA